MYYPQFFYGKLWYNARIQTFWFFWNFAMLKKFTVSNYRQFNKPLEFDLTAGGYTFNTECVKNDLVKLALIYGENGTGKTSLGRAIFDLVSHLTDKQKFNQDYFYINLSSNEKFATFIYQFDFYEQGEKFEVEYEYIKDNNGILQSEKLHIKSEKHRIKPEKYHDKGELVVNYELGKPFTTSLNGADKLNRNINPNQNLSVLKYIFNNTNLQKRSDRNKIFIQLMKYVDNILLFRNVFDSIEYVGFRSGNVHISKQIIEGGYLQDFELFLKSFGLDFSLVPLSVDYGNQIGIKFDNHSNPVPFVNVVSTGTKSLALFYYWWKVVQENNVPLLFIDEFDCSYHFDLSEKIVEKLKELPNTQVILTTHNTNLLSNELIRPDCSFVIDGKKIESLNKLTDKELREVHNLEKLYQAGHFKNEK